MWLEDEEDEEEEELPTYLLSALKRKFTASLQKIKMEKITPRTSFQQQKPKHPFHKSENLLPF